MENLKNKSAENIRLYNRILMVFFFSIGLYIIAGIYNQWFLELVSVADYLTWHVIFEFVSILVAFSIFTVSYFVYEESKRLGMIILGCSFLLMGLLDTFHTFSFKGMSDFFIANTTANRATSLWILSRTFGSLGFLLAVSIPESTISNIKKGFFAGITVAFSIILFVLVTYFPNVFPPMLIEGSGLTRVKIIMEFVVIAIMVITFLVVLSSHRKWSQTRDHQFLIALVFLIFSEFAFTNYGSVYDAFNYIGHIYKIIAYIILYKAIYIVNVSEPYREMKKARNELRDYSKDLNILVKQRTSELEEANRMLLKDIEYAREMQLRLLPSVTPDNQSSSFYTEYLPAERLSGDFYNIIQLDKRNIAIYIGDVSGHGVSAAMLTIFAIQNIEPFEQTNGNEKIIKTPYKVLDSVYEGFNDTNFKDETYILMLYGIFNTESKVFNYASAGMNVSPYIIKHSGEIVEINSRGFSICKLGEYIKPEYENRKVQMESGDKLLLYSDGLIEAKNSEGEIFGQDRMESFLRNEYYLNGLDLKMKLKRNLTNHIGDIDLLEDDVTCLIMEVH